VTTATAFRPLIIGEVLFDCFPDHRVLGGAPFNVAWNLRGMHLDPLLITAIGDDDAGREVIAAMSKWSLDKTFVQSASGYATGRVDISLASGEPTYCFWDNVAFDHISIPRQDAKAWSEKTWGLLYHGSLAMRSEQSRKTILELRSSLDCPVFVDINVRQPHFDSAWIETLLRNADHVKLNLDELALIRKAIAETASEHLTVAGQTGLWEMRRRQARHVQEIFNIKNIWLTAGSEGAAWLGTADEFVYEPAPPVLRMVDSVGAGDAFAAIIIRAIIEGTPPANALSLATRFAARVCEIQGATIADPQFYLG